MDTLVEREPASLLRILVDTRTQMQRARIQFGNRSDAISRETDDSASQQSLVVQRYHTAFDQLEEQLNSDIAKQVKAYDIYESLIKVKGIGPLLAGQLLALIPIDRTPGISNLWRFAGLAVIDGLAEKPKAGEKNHFNKRLKTLLFVVATSFLKSDSPYVRLYREAKVEYEVKHPEWSPLHRHRAALRKMLKVFLSHLWLRWRQEEGLSISQPYIFAGANGHHTYQPPEDFGWP